MISRVVLCLCVAGFGANGLLPAKPLPLTGQQLQAKAKQASKDKVCANAKRRKKTQELCKKWGLA
jgi:hypothetical protein